MTNKKKEDAYHNKLLAIWATSLWVWGQVADFRWIINNNETKHEKLSRTEYIPSYTFNTKT